MSENLEVKVATVSAKSPAKPTPKPAPETLKPVLNTVQVTEPITVKVIEAVEVKESKDDVQYREDHKKVKGIFRNLETPGGLLKFPFRKYLKDRIVTYMLFDGQTYEIPFMVAEHLNKNCSTPKYAYLPGTDMVQGVGYNSTTMSGVAPIGHSGFQTIGRNQRFTFQPIGFIHSPAYLEQQAMTQR